MMSKIESERGHKVEKRHPDGKKIRFDQRLIYSNVTKYSKQATYTRDAL